MESVMPGNRVFSFAIETNQVLSGAYHLKGRASAVESGDPAYMSEDSKETRGIPFDLTVAAISAVPEPGTCALVAGALGLLAFRAARKSGRFHSLSTHWRQP
jgi:hypothetical protein